MILDTLHKLIDDTPGVQILRLTKEQATEYRDYIAKYHINTPPPIEKFIETPGALQFMGRKITIYEPTE